MPPLDLREYSKEHLWYEVWMFFHLGKIIFVSIELPDPEATVILRNLIVEGFVLHLRNLLDFFYADPRKTDVSASMFFDPPRMPVDFPVESEALKDAHRRVHKEVSHLTAERRRPGERGWDNVPSLIADMKLRVEQFLQSASPRLLHPEFIERTTRLFRTE